MRWRNLRVDVAPQRILKSDRICKMLSNTTSKAAFNWWRSFQVALWIILQSADTKKENSQEPKKHPGCRGQFCELLTARDGCGCLMGVISQVKCQTHASLVEPLNPLHPHTLQLTLAFEGAAGWSSGYRRSPALWWELRPAGLPSTFSAIHIINFRVCVPSSNKHLERSY